MSVVHFSKVTLACMILIFFVLCTCNWQSLLTYTKSYRTTHTMWYSLNHTTTERWNGVKLIKSRMVMSIDCAKIFQNNRKEMRKARKLENDYLQVITSNTYVDICKNCSHFLKCRHYITSNLTAEEVDFPIAYGIVIYKAVSQFERLLRSIYRPQNFYCVHVDVKMSDINRSAVQAIVSCFNNVFISSRSYDVIWGKLNLLEANLICMKDLLNTKKWKYFINLTGQEFPLKTNLEIVKIFKSYNGANDVLIDLRKDFSHRWKRTGPSPDNLIPYKGSLFVAATRAFVEFAVKTKTSNHLLKWLKKTKIPDETFFTTLNYNYQLGIPGSITRQGITGLTHKVVHNMAKYTLWQWGDNTCNGKYIHSVCIHSIGDIPTLFKRPELFVNKLYWDYSHYALDCLEELIHNRTIDGFHGELNLDTREYTKLHFVKYARK